MATANKYIPTIGLEIHAELKTKTKMFCDCPNDPPTGEAGPEESHPNVNVCPICLGHPGTLPTINQTAIEAMIKIGYAVNGNINPQFKFDRKNYFYPDLPKGYQISQYDMPIVVGGAIDISARVGELKAIKLNRVHLEEDAGKLLHVADSEWQIAEENRKPLAISHKPLASLVDFNRGGLPLMELVSEPDIKNVKEAVAFAKELQLILRYLGVADADLERGQMRFDANVSVSAGPELGTKVEIKNLNSFAALESAINYEIDRQGALLDAGKTVAQETRGWDDVKKITVSQRSKEAAHDYRYFPEPDLPMLVAADFPLAELRLAVPELPGEKRRRLKTQFRINPEQVNILVEDKDMAEYFESAVSELEADAGAPITEETVKLLFNYLNTDLKGLMGERELIFSTLRITPENFADLILMISKKEISSRTAKDLLVRMLELGTDPREIVRQENLGQISDQSELSAAAEKIIAANPQAVADYRGGKIQALQFLVGKAMAELKGRGNPAVIRSVFEKLLNS